MKLLLGSGLLLLCTLPCWVVAQEGSERMDLLREEITILTRRMDETEAGRRSVVEQMQNLDRRIDLRKKLIRELQAQVDAGKRKVNALESKVLEHEKQIERLGSELHHEEGRLQELRKEVGARIVQIYKHLAGERLALLLTSRNLNDLSRRRHYMQAMERYDAARLDLLRQQRDLVATDRQSEQDAKEALTIEKARLLDELQQVRRNIDARKKDEEALNKERSLKDQMVKRISGDLDLLRALLDERRQALEAIENEINRLEKRAPQQLMIWQPDVAFKKLAGKLPWPVSKHKISQPFGRVTHPKLGTSTINPGIDIAATAGDPVYAIARGQITRVAWIRGFGNTVIIDHGEGYYSVYAKLGDIKLSEGEVVNAGQLLGEVGDSGAGGEFHLEIWGNREKLDPVKWLAR